MMMRLSFVLDQHAELGFYNASSLKQQSTARHVAPLGHIILIPSQPVCKDRGKISRTDNKNDKSYKSLKSRTQQDLKFKKVSLADYV